MRLQSRSDDRMQPTAQAVGSERDFSKPRSGRKNRYSRNFRIDAPLENDYPPRAIYSGIFPCFFGGFLSRFVSSMASAWINFFRVSRGCITASTNPRSATT